MIYHFRNQSRNFTVKFAVHCFVYMCFYESNTFTRCYSFRFFEYITSKVSQKSPNQSVSLGLHRGKQSLSALDSSQLILKGIPKILITGSVSDYSGDSSHIRRWPTYLRMQLFWNGTVCVLKTTFFCSETKYSKCQKTVLTTHEMFFRV